MWRHDRKRERLAGPVRLGPDGLLKLEFRDDDDVIALHGVFTVYVVDEIWASLDEKDQPVVGRSHAAIATLITEHAEVVPEPGWGGVMSLLWMPRVS